MEIKLTFIFFPYDVLNHPSTVAFPIFSTSGFCLQRMSMKCPAKNRCCRLSYHPFLSCILPPLLTILSYHPFLPFIPTISSYHPFVQCIPTILSYHPFLPFSTTIPSFHAFLPSLPTISFCRAFLPSLPIISSYHLFLPCLPTVPLTHLFYHPFLSTFLTVPSHHLFLPSIPRFLLIILSTFSSYHPFNPSIHPTTCNLAYPIISLCPSLPLCSPSFSSNLPSILTSLPVFLHQCVNLLSFISHFLLFS